jgi:HEAT repeat protein
MKRTHRLFLFVILAFGLQASAWANHHENKLAGIMDRFANEDAAAQYEARRELAAYVANATAPDKKDGAEKVTNELLGYLGDRNVEHEAKKYIIRDLARVGTGAAVSPLSKIMLGKDSLLAESARQALEQIDDKRATAVFRKAISGSKNDASRQRYIRSLANRQDLGTLSYFTKGLSSEDTILALESVYALTKMGNAKSSSVLEKAYDAGPAPEVRLELERSVVALANTDDSTLLEIANAGISSANRQAALGRLVESDHAQSNDLLSAAIAGSDTRLRATALRLALENGKQSLVQSQVKSFSSNDWRIVLGELHAFDPAVAEKLALQALTHSETGIQSEGLRALGTYGTAKSIDPVLEHFSGRDKELQLAATYAVARMPGNPMTFRVNRLLRSESQDDMVLGIQLLAHRDVPNAKRKLFKFINEDNAALAREALKTLSTTANEEDLYKLLFLARRSEDPLKNIISGMLKKVAGEIGSLELQAKVKAL